MRISAVPTISYAGADVTTPSRAFSTGVATLCVVAVAVAACSGSGYRYVKNSGVKTYFRVPDSWKLYNQDAISADQGTALSPQQLARTKVTQWVVAFDGDPKPSIDHVLDEHSRYPMGFARVRALSTDERETVSLQKLRNEVFPLDELNALQNRVEPLKITDLVRPGGLHGTREVHNIKADNGLSYLTIDQTVLVDPQTRLLYAFVVGCEANCYLGHKKVIDDVVRSWTIKER
jgi:hypothetical protein